MIDITFDLTLGVAKLATAATIKVGSYVPVRVTFTAPPGTASAFSLALGTDATPPALLAYTDVWAQESSSVWTATLDATDSRLVTYLAGKGATAVNAEFAATVDGVAQIAPNFQVTVQPRVVTGPSTSEGGPLYYSEAQVDALFTALAPTAFGRTLLAQGGASAARGALAAASQVIYVADGDSRTYTGARLSWFDLLCAHEPSVTPENYGIAGKTVAQIVAGYAGAGSASLSVSGGHQFSPHQTGAKGVYFIWAATNDLGAGASAAAVLANLQTLYAAAKTDGYGKVVAFTETPRAPAPGAGWEATAETQRGVLNASLRGLTLGLSNTPDVLIDTEALFPSYAAFSDGIHINAQQEAILATVVRARISGDVGSYFPFVALRWTDGGQTFSAGGGVTLMTGLATTVDNQSLYNATTHGILCPVGGWVQVSVSFLRVIAASGDVLELYIYATPAGGSAAEKFRLGRYNDGPGSSGSVNASAFFQVNAGDVLDFRLATTSTAGFTILPNTGFSSFTLRYVPVQ